MNALRASASAALFIFAVGCSGTDNPVDLPACEGPVTVSVGSGTTPDISWTVRCMAGQVIVGTNPGFVNFWVGTSADSTSSLRPPVRYGIPPNPDALPTQPLAAGGAYTAHVLRATGDSAAPFEEIGSMDFTR